MKTAPSSYAELYRRVSEHIGPDRTPTLIGFDGQGDAGKSSAASWLAWQLGIPSLHLDLYLSRAVAQGPIQWRINELANSISARENRCLIVEGVLLLDAIGQIPNRTLGYHVFVENRAIDSLYPTDPDEFEKDQREFALENQVGGYFRRTRPKQRADFVLAWHENL
jgi:hypothetical protein